MITEIIDLLREAFAVEMNQNGRIYGFKSLKYGTPQTIATTEMPCLLYNLIAIAIDRQSEITLRFGLYACSAITATVEQAAQESQELAWNYQDVVRDRGVLPLILSLTARQFKDSAGRFYRAVLRGEPKILTDNVNGNVRGAVYAELELKTIIKQLS